MSNKCKINFEPISGPDEDVLSLDFEREEKEAWKRRKEQEDFL